MIVTESKTSTTNKTLGYPLNALVCRGLGPRGDPATDVAPDRQSTVGPLSHRGRQGRSSCRCRLAPLSMGKLIGKDGIRCPYHGIVYNSAGRCVSMPAQETINPSATVPSFPVVGRHRYVRVWLGDPTLADPDQVPDMHQLDDPHWAGDGLTIPLKCNYQLVLDNLMDLIHHKFIHTSSIGMDNMSAMGFDVTHEDNTVILSWWMRNIDAPPFYFKNMRDKFPEFEGKVDRWQIIRFESTSTRCIDVGVAKAGNEAPEGDRSQGVNLHVMNTISPETDKSCRCFWGFMRNYRLESQLITTQIRESIDHVFGEDQVVLEAQQVAIDANPDYESYNLNIDAGGMWVRRLIERQLEAEERLVASK